MIALLQRVTQANVCVAGEEVGRIGAGLLVFIGVERNDGELQAQRLLQRVLSYRVFADAAGKMNVSVSERSGGLLVVPQFTLAAATDQGTRAGFSTAAPPDVGRRLFELFVSSAQAQHSTVATGIFGADMQVSLTNDGPVTFWLQVPPVSVVTQR